MYVYTQYQYNYFLHTTEYKFRTHSHTFFARVNF